MKKKLFSALLLVLSCLHWTSCLQISTDQQVENLMTFARMYGYTRFFHPDDRAEQINWDKFLLKGIEEVQYARNTDALNISLKKLFQPIAPSVQIYREGENPAPMFDLEAHDNLVLVGWRHSNGAGKNHQSGYLQSRRTGRTYSIRKYGATIYQISNLEVKEGTYYDLKVKIKVQGDPEQPVGRALFIAGDGRKEYELDSTDWTVLKMSGQMQKDHDRLSVIFRLNLHHPCEVWLDDVQLKIGSDSTDLHPFPVLNSGFELVQDSLPTSWSCNPAGDCTIKMDRVENSGQKAIHITKDFYRTSEVYPQFGEFFDRPLGNDLHCRVPLALMSKDDEMIGVDSINGFNLFKNNINNFDSTSYTINHPVCRIANYIKIWTTLHHFYPNMTKAKLKDWESVFEKELYKIINGDIEPMETALYKLLKHIGDQRIFVGGEYLDKKAFMPFRVEIHEGQIVVVHSDSDKIQKGDILLKMNGKSTLEIVEEKSKLFSGTEVFAEQCGLFYLTHGDKDRAVDYQIERKGERKNINMTFSKDKQPLSYYDQESVIEVENDIFYINLGIASLGEIRHHIKELEKAKGVIIDLRSRSQQNQPKEEILNYLTEQPSLNRFQAEAPIVIYPDREKVFRDTLDRYFELESKEKFKGEKVFLIDKSSRWRMELIALTVRKHKLGTIIGQPSCGLLGNSCKIDLIGDHDVFWSGTNFMSPDGKTYFKNIQPDILVQPDKEKIINGKDALIEAAVAHIQNNPI